MNYMEDLKDLLLAELRECAENGKRSGKMSKSDIEVIDTALNSVKNIYKIDKYMEETEGYSEDGQYMGEGHIYGTSYSRGRGRNARRDSMGRYSRDGGGSYRGGYSRNNAQEYMVERIEDMMKETDDPKIKRELERCVQAIENA